MLRLILEQLNLEILDSTDCLFCYHTKYKAAFTVLKFFYFVILTFKESLFLEIGNITEVLFQE